MTRAACIVAPDLWQSGHGPAHPLKPERLKRTYDLLTAYHAFGENSVQVPPRLATEEELTWFHTPEYVDAVQRLSRGDRSVDGSRYHLGWGDNPIFPQMYEIEALKTGSALVAAELVAEGQADVAFAFAGGMHHAMPDHASGFCVFNDPAVAIESLIRRGLRVVYIDIDAHHGDGVQYAFYNTDQVLTISLHESGRYLFPGTGYVSEIGAGSGKGYACNLPLPPYTGDELYTWAFREVVVPLVQRFAPDVLVSQLGADSHYLDPLTHLMLTSEGYTQLVEMIRPLAPRWVALGGGGYDVTVVPRLWTLAYGIMSGQNFPDALPEAYTSLYERGTLRDHEQPVAAQREPEPIRQQIRQTVAEIKKQFQL